jgi:transcriptional regulator with XRE-family HTH domain
MERDLADLAWLRRQMTSGGARATRLAADVSLREAADAADVAVSTLWRWEAGVRRPHGSAARRYALVLRSLNRAAAR